MTDPLHVQTDGVLNYSQLHSDVAAGLSGLAGVDGSGVETSHGTIASAVNTALSGVLAGRQNTIGVTSTAASTISDLLQKAAQAYAAGDRQGAERLKAAADVLEGKDAPNRGTASAASGAPASSGGAGRDMAGQMGQMLGQVGQQVGQMAQSIAQPLQGLAQGLQQIPQQIMQGVQQAAQSASGIGGQSEVKSAQIEKDDRRPEEKDEDKDKHSTERDGQETRAEAGPTSPTERAPVESPAPRERPAPTHPQAD
ncbi:type VII secretion target [Mycolicibacterium sp. J2]|uniref:type VII secretion target n=1 Tax=Mycolicibacterium sp. J2 TaxID=2993511 RepID=UPI00224AAF5D|nr:type VII secretion target [Mycolicibacterium sp. J2]MCX2716070.1 type VII secretion target [Mycolicibacterium sp. J2]